VQVTESASYRPNSFVGYLSHFRVEVVQPAGGTSGQFLHVLENSEVELGGDEPTPAIKLKGVGCTAARIGTSKLVVFADVPTVTTAAHGGKIEGRLAECSLVIDASGTYDVAIVELDVNRAYRAGGVVNVTRISDGSPGPWSPAAGDSGNAGVLYLNVRASAGQRLTLTSDAGARTSGAATLSAPRNVRQVGN
jgi:hypothetical protein